MYWDWKNGLRNHSENSGYQTFTELEKEFYEKQFGAYILGQQERNRKSGHSKRDRSIDDLLNDSRICPEETIYQIGKDGECPPHGVLLDVIREFMEWYERSFGSNIRVLDWALHLDETSPHIHARQVFFVTNRYGECEPKQEKALEEIGIPLPQPDKKPGRTNNRKMMFDRICREELIDICRFYGIEVETEPIYGGRQYLEKQDYIIEAQREKLLELEQAAYEKDEQLYEMQQQLKSIQGQLTDTSAQISDAERKLEEKQEELTDIDRLTEHLTDIVYNSAVDAVTAQAVKAAQEETIERLTASAKAATKNNGSFFRRSENEFLEKWLAKAGRLIRSTAEKVIDSVRRKLRKPETAIAVKTDITQKAKPSVKAVLDRYRQIPYSRTRPSKDRDCL